MQSYFRDAVGTDLPAIGAILRGAARSSSDDTPPNGSYRDALAEIDRTDGNYVLVAEYDRQIIAVLQMLAYRALHDRGRRTAQIVLVRVAGEFRTTGVRDMLIDHAAGRALDLGCRQLVAFTNMDSTNDHHTWERAGFIHVDRGYIRQLG